MRNEITCLEDQWVKLSPIEMEKKDFMIDFKKGKIKCNKIEINFQSPHGKDTEILFDGKKLKGIYHLNILADSNKIIRIKISGFPGLMELSE